MIWVCPLSRVTELVARHRPARVVSMLGPDWPFPELGADYDGRHLRLCFDDIHEPMPNYIMPAMEHIQAYLAFITSWDIRGALLIHCRAGISRSTAAAYIAACAKQPEASEHALAVALHRASPMARPNEVLIALADRALNRNGRMSQAISTTGRDLPWLDMDENEPFCLSLMQ